MSVTTATTQEAKRGDNTKVVEEIEKDLPVQLEPHVTGDGEQLPGMPREYSGWDVYNNEAKKVDTELVNDWTSSLNSLLLFAAIFAAVLTAFIIESKSLLEQDPTEAMLDVMIFVANGLANGTHRPYQQPNFEPPSTAVVINSLFFASLSASLVAGLASVVALQWVADYDAAIIRGGSSPEDRAKRRQFRYSGVVSWEMSEIIAALPLLLYASVILFLIGLTQWMWILHPVVGSVVAGGMAIAILFYGVTTLLSVAFVSAPFRTPLSRWIYSYISILLLGLYSFTQLLRIQHIPTWLSRHYSSYEGAKKREDSKIDKRSDLAMDALIWLANRLSTSQDSYKRLLLLANELRKQDLRHFESLKFQNAPWFSIFDLLGWKHLKIDPLQDISAEEMRAVAVLAHCYRIPVIQRILRPGERISYYWDKTQEEYWSQHCATVKPQWSQSSLSTRPNSLFLLLRDVPLPSKDTASQLEFTIRLSRWRNSPKQGPKQEAHHQVIPGDDSHLYGITVASVVQGCITGGGGLSPVFLDSLRLRFESILLGEEGHNLDAKSCLSQPLLYYKALVNKGSKYGSLHSDFTLLLARNIHSYSGAERARRVKEVLIMMWFSIGPYGFLMRRVQGMEAFFEANTKGIANWVRRLNRIPRILEILEHLARAQAAQPDIGSLWQADKPESGLVSAFGAFDELIRGDITREQHCILIDLICQDIEMEPLGTFKDFNVGDRRLFDFLRDPCLRFLAQFIAGLDATFADNKSPLQPSWARIAKHLLNYYKGTDSPHILKMQAFAWKLAPADTAALCKLALRDPDTLAHLKRIFEHPVRCGEHSHAEGHLLVHICEPLPSLRLPTDISALRGLPLSGHYLSYHEAVLLLSDGNEDLLCEGLKKQGIDQWGANRLLEMTRILGRSQFSLLVYLLSVSITFLSQAWDLPHHVAYFTLCVNKALDLPTDHTDHTALSLMQPLIGSIQQMDTEMRKRWRLIYKQDREIASAKATETINRLCNHIATLRVSGRRNSQVLFCARATETCSPAIGWLAPYT